MPELLDDYVAETNLTSVVDVFVDELDLGKLGFEGVDPASAGRPSYHPAILLKIYIYGYLNRVQSSRRLEREAQRNVELMWLTGRLMPDFKTIANFRRDNGKAIRSVCRQSVVICQQLGLFSEALVAIDGSKFKAVNNRDRNFTSFVISAGFTGLYDLPADETEKILADDTALMLFGFRFLRQVLFGENSITLKKEAVEKRREQVQKMAEQIEREARERRAAEQDERYGGEED